MMNKNLNERTFLGHPFQLVTLSSLEFWERFSYYGLTNILVLYLTFSTAHGGLGISENTALEISGAYGSLVYLSSIIGAWISDRILSQEHTLLVAAIVVALGHLIIGTSSNTLQLALGLIFIALGAGAIKTANTAIVGSLYKDDNRKITSGFAVFYTSINIGAFLGPLLTGWLRINYGFHAAFLSTAIGMGLGFLVYCTGRKKLPPESFIVFSPLTRKETALLISGIIVFAVVIYTVFTLNIISVGDLANISTIVVLLVSIGYFLVLTLGSKVKKPLEQRRVVGYIPFFLTSIIFWFLFQQITGGMLLFFTNSHINLNFFGFKVPPEWISLVEPLGVIGAAPLFASLWIKVRKPPNNLIKIIIAIFTISFSFALLTLFPRHNGSLVALAAILLLATLAEIHIAPSGLALVAIIAPEKYKTQTTSLYYLALSLGSALGGVGGNFYNSNSPHLYFISMATIGAVTGIIVTVFRHRIANSLDVGL